MPCLSDSVLKKLFLQQKMDDYLKSCLKNTDVMKSSAGKSYAVGLTLGND